MKTISAVILALLFTAASAGISLAATTLTVAEAAIASSMDGVTPVGSSDKFKADGGKVYCYTKIAGGTAGDSIRHVWHHGDKQVLEVALDVKGPSHRTYSNKTLYPGMTGKWRVDVVATDGTVIKSVNFTAE